MSLRKPPLSVQQYTSCRHTLLPTHRGRHLLLRPHMHMQVLAFLRVCVQQALTAFRSHSASSIAGLPEQEQQAYVVRFMREYLSQAWFDKLASTYNLSQHSLSELLHQSVHSAPVEPHATSTLAPACHTDKPCLWQSVNVDLIGACCIQLSLVVLCALLSAYQARKTPTCLQCGRHLAGATTLKRKPRCAVTPVCCSRTGPHRSVSAGCAPRTALVCAW